MTVSPTRPSDGSRQSELSSDQDFGRRREMESMSDSSALPPVLFNLRNLSPAKPAKVVERPPIASEATVTHAVAQTAKVDPASATLAHSAVAHPIAASATVETRPEPASADELQNQTSSNSSSTRVSSSPKKEDRPAGRTWMEAAVAHRNVLMLLAIVIVVALWTSRNSSSQSDYEASLVDADEVLEFDSGELMAGNEMNGAANFGQSELPHAATRTSDSRFAETEKRNANPPQTAAVLNPPESLSSANSSAMMNKSISGAETSGMLSPGVGASTVSSRKPINSRSPGLPSLEDLASEHGIHEVINDQYSVSTSLSSSETFVEDNHSQSPALSQTPAAVGNWLRFLPPLPNASVSNQ